MQTSLLFVSSLFLPNGFAVDFPSTTGVVRSVEFSTGHTRWINSVTFSPDGETIASGSYDDTIRLWDAVTGELKRTLTGHTAEVFSVAFSPDGKTIASGNFDSTIRLWAISSLQSL